MADPPDRNKHGFVAYAHEDADMFGTFRTHLKALERPYAIRFWFDQDILAGKNWEREIEKAIGNAKFFLLMLSPGFIASNYIYDTELPAIRARHRDGVPVVPVYLRECLYTNVWPGLQTVPIHKKLGLRAVEKWRPTNTGYNAANAQLAMAIEGLLKSTPNGSGDMAS